MMVGDLARAILEDTPRPIRSLVDLTLALAWLSGGWILGLVLICGAITTQIVARPITGH
jgi:hypothetical protein